MALYLKKSLGQHFLHDEHMLGQIAGAIGDLSAFKTVVEIGPGMGALTKHLVGQNHPEYYVVELDDRWAEYLPKQFPTLKGKVLHGDVLRVNLDFMQNPTHVVGNFPYNISSQIVFRVLEYKERVQQLTGMFQKEMAKRIAAPHGGKDYGVISVLTQAHYNCIYLFDVPPDCFTPPPKVMSGIIKLVRKQQPLDCEEAFFRKVVKAAFNQRRKTMRNSLKAIVQDHNLLADAYFDARPEQLSVEEFIALTNKLQAQGVK